MRVPGKPRLKRHTKNTGMRKWIGDPRMRGETESLSSPPTLGGAGLGPLSSLHYFISFEIVCLGEE